MNIASRARERYDRDVSDTGEGPRNVLGSALEVCSREPPTGFFRDGRCRTGLGDAGVHVVCARMTDDFLLFSRSRGNDLITPIPRYGFRGLRPGDRWCLCAARWKEALEAGVAPPVYLAATAVSALEYVSLDELSRHALDASGTE